MTLFIQIVRPVLLLSLVHLLITSSAPPPEDVPVEFKDSFTMNGEVPLQYYYVDDSNGGQGTHYKFSWAYMEELVQKTIPDQLAYLRSRHFIPEKAEALNDYVEEGRDEWQERLDSLFMTLLHKNYWPLVSMAQHPHFFEGAKVAVFGSMDPYFESVALFLGASKVTTFEYNELTYGDNSNEVFEVITGQRYDSLLKASRDGGQGSADYNRFKDSFDVVLSFSSFDHSGLGRYGDTIDGDADLAAMRFARTITKPGGHLFLTLPIGPDVTVWNLQRRYGRKRLPLMLQSFFGEDSCIKYDTASHGDGEERSLLTPYDIVSLGWKESKALVEADYRKTYEPVLILNK